MCRLNSIAPLPLLIAPLLMALLMSCAPNTDLTVAPPVVKPTVVVDIPDPLVTGRLPAGQTPTHYKLTLEIDPAEDTFNGEARITIALTQPRQVVVLHGAGLRVFDAEAIIGEKSVRAETIAFRAAAGASGPDAPTEELVIAFAEPIAAGSFDLLLSYQAPLTDSLKGIYRATDGDKRFVFTQLEPSDARRMFPCFDDPIFKTTFDVTLVTPADVEAFANAPRMSKEPRQGGDKMAHTFATSKKMPTYLVAIAVGPLETLQGQKSPTPIRVIAAKGKSRRGKLASRSRPSN